MVLKRKRDAAKVDDLPWQKVDVTQLDDFEGFFGLEEVDGVGVDIVDGVVKFKQQADAPPKKKIAKSETAGKKKGAKPEKPSKNIVKKNHEKKEVDSENESEIGPEIEIEAEESEPKEVKTESTEKAEKKKPNLKKKTKKAAVAKKNNFAALEDVEEDDSHRVKWEFEDHHGQVTLSDEINRALYKLKFFKPTDIQKQAIPVILSGQDLVGKAATGSGKTLAYGIPIIEKHLTTVHGPEKIKNHPTALIFAPTRELAHQITKHLQSITKYCTFGGSGIVPITGGLAVQKQERLLKAHPAVIVVTPGRFLDILKSGGEEMVNYFAKTEMLVLDEADRLIQDGHFQELENVLDLIGRGKKSKNQRQTLVFSATFQRDLLGKLTSKKRQGSQGKLATNDEALGVLKRKLQFKDKNPAFIDSNPAENVAKAVTESIMECGATEKDLYLYYFLLSYTGRSIVFVNSIETVKRLTPMLKELELSSFGLHSDMIQKQRLRSLERFAATDNGVLIATDVAARGLDIPSVQHVIHYHLPRSADMYVHRSGRTARAGAEGISLILCSPEESSGPLVKLKRVLNHSQALKTFDVEYNFLNRLKDRVRLAKKISDATVENTYKGKTEAWLREAADDLGVDLDEMEGLNDKKFKKKKQDKSITKEELKVLRAQLRQELQKPVGYAGKYLTHGKNLAQLLVSGKTHENFVGREKKTALQAIQ